MSGIMGAMGRGQGARMPMAAAQSLGRPQAAPQSGYGSILDSILGGGVGQFQPQGMPNPNPLQMGGAPQGVIGGVGFNNPTIAPDLSGRYSPRGSGWNAPTITTIRQGLVADTPLTRGMRPDAVRAPNQQRSAGGGGPAQSAIGGFRSMFDEAQAANQARYDEGLGLIRGGRDEILGDLGDTYGSLFDRNNEAGDALQDRIGTGGQQLRKDQQAGFAAAGKNAKSRGSELTGYTDSGYAALGDQAAQSGSRQMDFLNQQQQGMLGLLNSQSNAEYEREARRHTNASSEATQNLISSGLLNTSTRPAIQRGIDDDSALREAEIGDRRLNKAIGLADSYTGRGLGVMGNADSAALNVGQNAINAGLGVRSDLNNQLGNIEMQGLTADSNLASDLFGMGNTAMQQQQQRDLQLAGQYGGARTDILGNMLGQETQWIYNREDAYPDMNQLLGLLQQPGALGQNFNNSGGYNSVGGGMLNGSAIGRDGLGHMTLGGSQSRQGGGVNGFDMLPPISGNPGSIYGGINPNQQQSQQQGNPFSGQQQATGRPNYNLGNTGMAPRRPTTQPASPYAPNRSGNPSGILYDSGPGMYGQGGGLRPYELPPQGDQGIFYDDGTGLPGRRPQQWQRGMQGGW
jgi:hypothetical protein